MNKLRIKCAELMPVGIFLVAMLAAGIGIILYMEGKISFMSLGGFVIPGIMVASIVTLWIPSLVHLFKEHDKE